MRTQSDLRLPLAIRLAHAISRLLTWGMTADERRRFLSESLADWEAMARETSPWQLVWRALRGIPSAIWIRLSDRDVTSLPAGVALIMVGIGGMVAGSQASALPAPFRHYVVVAAAGLVLLGLNFLRDPRRLALRKYRFAGLLIAVGFTGLAIHLPTAAEWPYDGPVFANRLIDTAMQVSFVLVAAGFALVIVASFQQSRTRIVSVGGVILTIGVATLGLSQVSWAIGMAPIDLTMTAASVIIGLAALSFSHVLPRLRHLDVTSVEDKEARRGRESTDLDHHLWKGAQ